jgi:hypothetical protein
MNAFKVIFLAGLTCGVLDLIAASTSQKLRGGSVQRLMQGIARGALGPSAFAGGKRTVGLGVLFHFCIAFSAAIIYSTASRNTAFLLSHAVISGLFYGIAIHLFMTFLVLPRTRLPKRKFSLSGFLIQLLIHMFCVGLPISLVIQRFS